MTIKMIPRKSNDLHSKIYSNISLEELYLLFVNQKSVDEEIIFPMF